MKPLADHGTTATRPTASRDERERQRYLNRKRRDLNRHQGIPNRHDPAVAIEHINLLRRTMSWAQIAAASGCSGCYLRNIQNGDVPQINGLTQRKILAVQPTPQAAPGFYIDAIPSVRRVRALMAAGHAQHIIATAADTTQYRISLLSRGQARIRVKLAEKIATAYEHLAHTQGTSARARFIAAEGGWHDPAYWEDTGRIDDLAFDPDATLTRVEQIAEDAAWLLDCGLNRDQAAARLGITRRHLDRALRESREEQAA